MLWPFVNTINIHFSVHLRQCIVLTKTVLENTCWWVYLYSPYHRMSVSQVRESRGQLTNDDATLNGVVANVYIFFWFLWFLFLAHGPHGWFQLSLHLLWVLCIVTICWSTSPLDFRHLSRLFVWRPWHVGPKPPCVECTHLCQSFVQRKGRHPFRSCSSENSKWTTKWRHFKLYVHETVFPLCLFVKLLKHCHCHVWQNADVIFTFTCSTFCLFWLTHCTQCWWYRQLIDANTRTWKTGIIGCLISILQSSLGGHYWVHLLVNPLGQLRPSMHVL